MPGKTPQWIKVGVTDPGTSPASAIQARYSAALSARALGQAEEGGRVERDWHGAVEGVVEEDVVDQEPAAMA